MKIKEPIVRSKTKASDLVIKAFDSHLEIKRSNPRQNFIAPCQIWASVVLKMSASQYMCPRNSSISADFLQMPYFEEAQTQQERPLRAEMLFN